MRILRTTKIIEIYEPFKIDNCTNVIDKIKVLEEFLGNNSYSNDFKTNFPTQNDSHNCGICIMALVYNSYDLID